MEYLYIVHYLGPCESGFSEYIVRATSEQEAISKVKVKMMFSTKDTMNIGFYAELLSDQEVFKIVDYENPYYEG